MLQDREDNARRQVFSSVDGLGQKNRPGNIKNSQRVDPWERKEELNSARWMGMGQGGGEEQTRKLNGIFNKHFCGARVTLVDGGHPSQPSQQPHGMAEDACELLPGPRGAAQRVLHGDGVGGEPPQRDLLPTQG